jgi:hypothetical protein
MGRVSEGECVGLGPERNLDERYVMTRGNTLALTRRSKLRKNI